MKRLLCIAIAIINFCLPGKIYPKNTPKIAEDKKLVLDFNDDISENAQIKNFGALWSKNGISQGCYEFDGASSCMAIPSSNLKIGDEFTISMWTYRKSEKKGGLLYKEGLFNLNTSYWGIFKNDKWHIIEYDLPVNKWSNIIAIKKKNEIQLYINGKLAGRKEIISEKNKNSNSELYIGAIPAWGKKWQYNGKIDEVIIYGKALAKENFPKSPPPFPSPQKTNVQKINQIKNVKNAQENLQEKILPKAEILNCKGAPCLFINGIPQSGMLYCTFPGMFRTFQYSESGINLYYIKVKTRIPPFNYNEFDNKINALLKSNPLAYIMLRVQLPVREDFAKETPGELTTFENGKTSPYLRPKKASISNPNTGRFTFASEIWKKKTAQELENLVEHVKRSDYADRIIGFAPGAGLEYQWAWWADFDKTKLSIDFSPAMKLAFQKWLRKKYKNNIESLRKAWNDPNITFTDISIPDRKERDSFSYGNFYSPNKNRKVIDYYKCHNDVICDKIIYFCKLIKELTDKRSLTGLFFNPIHALYGAPRGGNSLYYEIYTSPYIDFLVSPYTYENRGVGDSIEFTNLSSSLKSNHKLYVCESDTRTLTANDPYYGTPDNLEETFSIMWRDFSKILTTGSTGYWYGFNRNWFNPEKIPGLLEEWKKMQKIAALSLNFNRASNGQIAVIVDEESLFYGNQRYLSYNSVERERIHELCRLGTMPDAYDIRDLMRNPDLCSKYKMFIFLNLYAPDNEKRDFINKHLKKQNHTLIWTYGSGIINPDKTESTSTEYMESLTGIKINAISTNGKLQMRTLKDINIKTLELPPGENIGGLERSITTNPGISKGKAYLPKPIKGNPIFYVNDTNTRILANFTENGKAGCAIKEMPDWTSVYIGSTIINSWALRAFAKYAKVHTYINNDDIIYQNDFFLAIHTKLPGKKHIKLLKKTGVYNLIKGKIISDNADEIIFNAKDKETYLFFIGPINDFLTNMKRIDKEFARQKTHRINAAKQQTIKKTSPCQKQQKMPGLGPYKIDGKGFIKNWLICGPFPNGGSNEEFLKKNFLGRHGNEEKITPDIKSETICANFSSAQVSKEKAFNWFGICHKNRDEKIETNWKAFNFKTFTINPEENGLDFFTYKNIVWYAACYLNSKQKTEISINVGADDGFKLWFNHHFIGELSQYKSIEPENKYRVTLNQGMNLILLKIIQVAGPTRFRLQLSTMEGQPFYKAQVYLTPQLK